MNINKISQIINNAKKIGPIVKAHLHTPPPIIKQDPKYMTPEVVEAFKARVQVAFPPKTENELTAVSMNKLALKNIKEGIDTTFPNATPEDFKILKDDAIRKFIYQNPKSGNLYHLINKGKGENGNVLIRALDKQGAFINEISVKPKTVAVLDNFSTIEGIFPLTSHGELVCKFLEAYNPAIKIIKYRCENQNKLDGKLIQSNFKKIPNYNNSQKDKIDFINCSLGDQCDFSEFKNWLGQEQVVLLKAWFTDKDFKKFEALTKEITTEHKTRILFAASNEGKDYCNSSLLAKGVEGVGALSNEKAGKIADFSGSRFAYGATHYEQGVFEAKGINGSINVTGTSGLDFEVTKELDEMIHQQTITDNLVTEDIDNIPAETLKKYIETKVFRFEDYYKKICGFDEIPECIPEETFVYKNMIFTKNKILFKKNNAGTSFSTPIRVAKLALNDSLKDYLP